MNIENANIGASRDLSRGAPVHVSQPQRWANTNRLSFIAVWQKPTRLELNPPKTTTQSWGLIQSPNIRGNVRTLVHLSSVKNPPRRKTQSRDALLLSNFTGRVHSGCDGFRRLRSLSNSDCIYTFLHKFLFYMEAGVQKVGSFVNGMCIAMALWKSLRASGHFAEVPHECPPLWEHCTIVHRTPLRWMMSSLMLPLHRILFYGHVKGFGWKMWFSATTRVLQLRHLIQQYHLNLRFLSSSTPFTHIPYPTSSLLK